MTKDKNGIHMQVKYKEMIENTLNKYRDKTAITYMRNSGENTQVSFGDVERFLYMTEESIGKYGLQKGDRVAIISPHSPWAVFTGISLTYAGITIVLIDASLPKEEIEKLLEFSEVKALFTTGEIYHRFKQIINVPCFSLDEGLKLVLLNEGNVDVSGLIHTTEPDMDVIAILYSSGTTGQMKGIMGTYESVLKAREIFVRLSGLKDYMTYLLVLPFNHIAGFTGAMTFFLTGCEIGFIEDVNASKLQNGLLKFQPYYFAMVPKVYEVMEQKIRATIHEKGKGAEMLMNTLFKLSKFFRKYFGINIGRKMFKSITKQVFGENIFGIGTGASPCKDETTEFFLNLGLEWANLYATTETSVPIVATGIHDRYPVNTVGNVTHHPEIQLQIKNPDSDGIGEIMVKSELMMKGYFKRPDLTAEAFENGFFKTGDYGYIDKKGYLHITGRIKESIVLQNGKKVSPADVDDYYLAKITDYDIASRGILNEKEACDEIHMFVANREYTSFEQKEIKTLFEEMSRKAPSMYKLSGIHFVSDIPRTSVGKVKRFCLKREEAVAIENIKKSNASGSSKLLEIISKHCNALDLTFESKIVEDLGLDSLTIFTIVCEIENEYGVDISSELEHVVTVKDVYELINNRKIDTQKNYPRQKKTKMIKSLKRWIALSKSLYKIETIGAENIPAHDDYIICANHESYFDPLWILAAMNGKADLSKVCCMAAKHTMEGKISRNLFEALGGISVDREGNTIPAMNSAKKCLENGRTLIIFPEGARSRDGCLLPFKSGAAKLAIDTNKKIIPVRIEGSFEIFPRWIKYPRLFDWKHFRKYSLTVRFGTPINPNGMQPDELTMILQERIKNYCVDNNNEGTIDYVYNTIRNLLELNEEFTIAGDMRLSEDLGMDSLKIFEMCVAIDEKYNVSIESRLDKDITVSEIIDLIEHNSAVSETDNISNYPLKRTDRDYKKFDRFMKISKLLWNFEVAGVENIETGENYIFCPNHESHYDGTWVIGNLNDRIKHSICSIAADYLFEKKIYRAGLIRMGGIPIHRSGNTTTAMKRAYECISKEGYSLLIHPEGTRTRSGELGEFKQGAAKLAIDTGVKIVPVCIDGAYEIFPPNRVIPRLFDWKHFRKYTLKIQFGTPIEPDGLTAEEITTEVRQDIVEMKCALKG